MNADAAPSSGRPEPVDRLIDEFTKLPGIGRRSAERVAFHLLKATSEEALRLSQAISDVKHNVRPCSICCNLTDVDPCRLCDSPRRDASVILVVEQPKDVLALEQTGIFTGVYHVLRGRLDPLRGVEAEDITIDRLMERVADPACNSRETEVREVILGLNPDLEGDSTALFLSEQIVESRPEVQVTRLARGLPSGSQLEYANKAVLADAIQGRQSV